MPVMSRSNRLARPQIGRYLYYLLEYLETLETNEFHICIVMGDKVAHGLYQELYDVYVTVEGSYLPDNLSAILSGWLGALGYPEAMVTKEEDDVIAMFLSHHGITIQAHWWGAITGERDQVTLLVR